MLRATTLTLALAGLILSPAALAQGGAPAPDFSEPCPALYPGDDASRERIARWMARGAAERGLPRELPVMAAIAESGLRNLRGESYHGFFGMLGTRPLSPARQLRWFLDTAELVRQRRVAEARPDPAADPASWGEWIADVERPAAHNRDGYQPHLEAARELIDGRCAPPASEDTTPPALRARIPARQRPLTAGGIVVRLRCAEEGCLTSAAATLTAAGRERTRRTPASEATVLIVPLPRAARRWLAAGERIRARVTVTAADTAANAATKGRSVLLLP